MRHLHARDHVERRERAVLRIPSIPQGWLESRAKRGSLIEIHSGNAAPSNGAVRASQRRAGPAVGARLEVPHEPLEGHAQPRRRLSHLAFGRIVVSDIEAPNVLVNLV